MNDKSIHEEINNIALRAALMMVCDSNHNFSDTEKLLSDLRNDDVDLSFGALVRVDCKELADTVEIVAESIQQEILEFIANRDFSGFPMEGI